jgi:glutamate:GABA antiporter
LAEASPKPELSGTGLRRELGLRDVSLFAIACICGARWIAPAARAGPGSLLLWALAAIFFAIPLAIAIAALGAKHARPGGFYWWTRADYGPWHGFLCFWTYWTGIAFWFPSAAMFYMSMAASALGYSAPHRFWMVAASLGALWIALGLNIAGMTIGKWTENAGALACWAMALVLGGAAAFVFARQGSATRFHVAPDLSWGTVGFWASIAYAMSGMELVGLMGGEIRNPERALPRAAAIASTFAALFYIAATAAVLVVLTPPQVRELTGLGDAAARAGALLGARWLEPAVALLVLISAVGQFGGIGAATSRLPFALGVDRLLPAAFSRLHPRWRTPHISMLALGGVSSAILIATQFGDTARAAYDTMVSLMVIAGFAPYIYIFGSAWRAGRRVSAASGLAVTAIAIACSVIPSNAIGNFWLFEGKLAGATALVIVSARLIYNRYARQSV